MKKLEPGTTLYFLIESIADRSFSGQPYHYEITSGKIEKINEFEGSRADEYMVPTQNRYGRTSCLEYPMCKNVGKTCWLTYDEAAAAADRATDRHESIWGWSLKKPMIRPWKEGNQ